MDEKVKEFLAGVRIDHLKMREPTGNLLHDQSSHIWKSSNYSGQSALNKVVDIVSEFSKQQIDKLEEIKQDLQVEREKLVKLVEDLMGLQEYFPVDETDKCGEVHFTRYLQCKKGQGEVIMIDDLNEILVTHRLDKNKLG